MFLVILIAVAYAAVRVLLATARAVAYLVAMTLVAGYRTGRALVG